MNSLILRFLKWTLLSLNLDMPIDAYRVPRSTIRNRMANSVDPDEAVIISHLIWICTVCKGICIGQPNWKVNPAPAELGYTRPLQTVQIQISWLLKKPTELDLHCLQFSIWICINYLDQVNWLAVPASVAQLDAPSDWRPGGRGFNPRRGRQHSFVEIDHEIFSTVILSLPLIQEGQLSVSGERMRTILVNRLED